MRPPLGATRFIANPSPDPPPGSRRVVISHAWSAQMLHPDYLPAPAPASLLARAVCELSSVNVRITPLTVACYCTDAGASDEEVQRALQQLAAAGSTEAAA